MSICDDCPFKQQIEQNTVCISQLDKELAVVTGVTDLKYQTIIELLTDIKADKVNITDRLIILEKAEPLNKYKTNKSLNWIESVTIGKIAALTIAILTIVAMIKGG